MRRIICFVLSLFLLITTAVRASVYEKKETFFIASGITRTTVKFLDESGYQYVNIVKADLNNKSVKAGLVMPKSTMSVLTNVKKMAEESQTTVLVNGDFFAKSKTNGSPVGITVHNGKLLSNSSEDEKMAAIKISGQNVIFDYFKTEAKIISKNGESAKIRNVNKLDPLDEICLYTNDFYKVSPGSLNGICEVFVENGIIKEIRREQEGAEVPENGYLLRFLPDFSTFILDNFKEGDKIELDFKADVDYKNCDIVGGGTLLVRDGKKVEKTHDVPGKYQRTAVGTDETGKILYMVTADKAEGGAAGMSLDKLADYLLSIGVYNAINLDGGGSTALVVKDFLSGKQKIVSTELSLAYIRPVINGFGIFSTAKEGKFKSFEIRSGKAFCGIENEFEIFNVIDEFGNPSSEKVEPEFKIKSEYGEFKGNVLIPKKAGKNIEVTATYKNYTAKTKIDILEIQSIFSDEKVFKDKVNCRVFAKSVEGFEKEVKNFEVVGEEIRLNGFSSKIYFADEILNSKISFDFSKEEAKSVPQDIEVKDKFVNLLVYSPRVSRQSFFVEFSNGDKVEALNEINFSGYKNVFVKIPSSAEKIIGFSVEKNKLKINNSGEFSVKGISFAGEKPKEEKAEAPLEVKESADEYFTVFGKIAEEKNLFSRLLINRFEKETKNSQFLFSLEGTNAAGAKTIKSHSSFEDEKSIFVCLDNSGGYISSKQYNEFAKDMNSDKKNMFIFMNENIDGIKSEFENEMLFSLLNDVNKEKSLIVFCPGNENEITFKNGIKIVKVKGMLNSSPKNLIENTEDFSFACVSKNGEIVFRSLK